MSYNELNFDMNKMSVSIGCRVKDNGYSLSITPTNLGEDVKFTNISIDIPNGMSNKDLNQYFHDCMLVFRGFMDRMNKHKDDVSEV